MSIFHLLVEIGYGLGIVLIIKARSKRGFNLLSRSL